jgi:hypothetical protein
MLQSGSTSHFSLWRAQFAEHARRLGGQPVTCLLLRTPQDKPVGERKSSDDAGQGTSSRSSVYNLGRHNPSTLPICRGWVEGVVPAWSPDVAVDHGQSFPSGAMLGFSRRSNHVQHHAAPLEHGTSSSGKEAQIESKTLLLARLQTASSSAAGENFVLISTAHLICS